jgi:outer membrane lipoprotein carrier protein
MRTNQSQLMIKTFLLTFVLLLTAYMPIEAKELSGEQVIKKVQKTYDKLETLSASFRHEFIWAMVGETEVSEGTMLLSGDNLFRYETDSQIIDCDGVTLWRYNQGSQQIIAENIATADPGSLPRDFLFDFPKQFNIESSEELEDDKYQLSLVPKENGLGVSNVSVIVDSDIWITTRISFDDDSGNTTIYELLDVELNVELDDSQFQFTPPESATLFDLR